MPIRVAAVTERTSLVVALTMMVPDWDVRASRDADSVVRMAHPDAVIIEAATTAEGLEVLSALRDASLIAPAVVIGDVSPEDGALDDGRCALLLRPFTIVELRDQVTEFVGEPTVPTESPSRGGIKRLRRRRLVQLPPEDAEVPASGSGEAASSSAADLAPPGTEHEAGYAPAEIRPRPDHDEPADLAPDPDPTLEHDEGPEEVAVEVRDPGATAESGAGDDPPPDDRGGHAFDATTLLAELLNAFDPDNASVWTPTETGSWAPAAAFGLRRAEGSRPVRADQPLFAAVSENLDGALLAPADLARGKLAGVPGSWAEDVMAAGMALQGRCIGVVVVGGAGLERTDLHRLLVLVNGAAPTRQRMGARLRGLLGNR